MLNLERKGRVWFWKVCALEWLVRGVVALTRLWAVSVERARELEHMLEVSGVHASLWPLALRPGAGGAAVFPTALLSLLRSGQ